MKKNGINNKGSGTIFENKFLEYLTRTPFYVPVIFYYAVSMACIVMELSNNMGESMGRFWMVPVGLFFFTLVEYLVHRFLFHFHANSPGQEKIKYSIHGVHHEYPRDKDRLVMPMLVSLPLSLFCYFVFYFLFGAGALLFFAGFMAGYSSYLMIHYAVHARKPPGNFLKYWWKHHSLHHYSSELTAFSVSLPFWDLIFGTLPSGNPK